MKTNKIRPSAIPAILECARYEDRAYTYADASAGAIMHDYTESMVCMEPGASAIGELSQEQREACEQAAPEILQFFKDQVGEVPILREQKVQVYDENMNLVTEGTADLVADAPVVVGLDIKSGFDFKPYLHDYRGQIKAYALALMQQKGKDRAIFAIYFLMPRKLLVYELTYEECEAAVWGAKLRRDDLSIAPQACRHCRYCKNLVTCQAANPGLAIVQDQHRLKDLNYVLAPHTVTEPEIMAQALIFVEDVIGAWSKRLKEISDTVKDCALAMSLDKDLPYYKRVTKAGKKSVPDADGAWAILNGTVGRDAFYKSFKISLPDLARNHSMEMKGMGVKLTIKDAREKLEGMLDPVMVSDAGKPDLVRLANRS